MPRTERRRATAAAGGEAKGANRGPLGRCAHLLPRLAVGGAFVVLYASCGEDAPTSLGSDQRTAPEDLRSLEIGVVEDIAFDSELEISLRRSSTGQLGSQGPHTTHLLLDFLIATFTEEEGEQLALDGARLEIDFANASPQQFRGVMQVSLSEVDPDSAERAWTNPNTVLTEFPKLRPGPAFGQDTVSCAAPDFEIGLDPKLLFGFDDAIQDSMALRVNVACMFDTFTIDGPGFMEFPYRGVGGASNVHLVGIYGTQRIERSVAPETNLAFVEFDPDFSPDGNMVVSDGHRWHTYVRFPDLESTPIPESAFVHRADLILYLADRRDTIFGSGPDFGVVVPGKSDPSVIFSKEENDRTPLFRGSLSSPTRLPCTTPTFGDSLVIQVTTYLFDQQDGNVPNNGMLLRLTDEGIGARHFEFFGSAAAESVRPRIKIIYALPPDFSGEQP